MSISILGSPSLTRIDRMWRVNGYFQFSGTTLSGVLPINTQCPRIVGGIKIKPQGPTTAGGGTVDTIEFDAGTVSASANFEMIAPRAGSISLAEFVVHTTVATDAANIWTIGIINKTATLTPVDIATAANSNTATTGAAFTAFTPRGLTLNSAAQLLVNANDELEWTFTKASSAANLVNLNLTLQVTATGSATEDVYPDVAALITTSGSTAGYLVPTRLTTITPNQLAVNIVRRGTPTSGLICAFEYEGF